MLMVSCQEPYKKLRITNFDKMVIDTIKFKDKSYSNAKIKIKGYVSDTIKVKFYEISKEYFGEIDDQWNMDYYGGMDVIFCFDPFKAKDGEVTFEYGIH